MTDESHKGYEWVARLREARAWFWMAVSDYAARRAHKAANS